MSARMSKQVMGWERDVRKCMCMRDVDVCHVRPSTSYQQGKRGRFNMVYFSLVASVWWGQGMVLGVNFWMVDGVFAHWGPWLAAWRWRGWGGRAEFWKQADISLFICHDHFLFAFPVLAHEREARVVVRCGGEKMRTCDTFLVLLTHDFVDVVCFVCVWI